MKRGIFRIIAGSIMILLQLLSMISLSSTGYYPTTTNVWRNIGFYSVGIVGIILLMFGIRAYNSGMCSQLILHTRSRKFHTVIKWVMFVITSLLCVNYLITFIQYFDSFNIYTLMMIFATLSFAVYLLFYIYKRPSCLPSTSLIFIGIAYLYDIFGNMTYYLFDVLEYDFGVLMLIFRIIPELIAGILYIVLASKLYKENFSVKAVKAIGWIVLVMEISNSIIYPVIISIYSGFVFYFYDLSSLLYILFALGLLLYMCAFKINTLKKHVVDETTDIVRYCRKCGNILLERAKFCNKCGTEILIEIEEQKITKKCELCYIETDHLLYCEIKGEYGTRYRNICDECVSEYNAKEIK